EQARGILPVAQYSEIYATVDLRNLLHFLSLRLHEHAQQEIRVFAQAMYDLIKTKDELKWTLEVFEETMKLDWAFLDALNAARKKKNGIEDLINILENFQKEEKE
ncbi:MAG: FAD-dependent thymidylate synthase, partial [bacterium]